MNVYIRIGFGIGLVVQLIDRWIHKLPSKLAVFLYLLATIFLLVGTYVWKKSVA